MTNYYDTLGVAKNATPDDIKKAYRRMAKIHHPDKGGDTAKFQEIQTAYETLSDPQKKQEYDNPNPFMGRRQGQHAQPGGFHFEMNGFDINDMFGAFFGQRQHGFRPQPPSYRTTVWVTLEQVYVGGEHTMQFQTMNGIQTAKIQIPKGVEDGMSMRYDQIIQGSILIVEFKIQTHHKYQRNGINLHSIQEVSIFDLIVGSTFNFTTLGGKNLEVKIKPNTQPGSTLRLIGEGLPHQTGYGDQMILLKPFIPDTIDTRIIDAINQFK